MKSKRSAFLTFMVVVISILIFPSCKKTTDEAFFDIIANGLVGVNDTQRDLLPSAVVIPKKVKGVAVSGIIDLGFREFSNLESVIIPKGVVTIGFEAFNSCNNLASVSIPKSVTSIGVGAFGYCNSLESIIIPKGVTSLGGGAFDYCTNLASITIANSVTFIGRFAFNQCSSLESITIPESVTTIENDVFSNCSSLKSINYSGTIKQWNAIDITNLGENFPATYVSCKDGQVEL